MSSLLTSLDKQVCLNTIEGSHSRCQKCLEFSFLVALHVRSLNSHTLNRQQGHVRYSIDTFTP